MDLRTASRLAIQKDLTPFLLEAIRIHPNPVDFRITQGNIVTARDYARRFLTRVRKEGIKKVSAARFRALKPPIRVYLNNQGLTFSGMTQKRREPAHWKKYQPPFKIMEASDVRWTTLVVNPSNDEIRVLAVLLSKGVLECPVEIRSKLTLAETQSLLAGFSSLHIFKLGRNVILWPQPEIKNVSP